MRKLLPILLCLLLLAGCKIVVDKDMVFDVETFSKAQKVEVSHAATGEAVRELTTEAEIEEFADALTVGRWYLADPPEGAVREGAFTLYQSGTVLFGGREQGTMELCTFFSYAGEPYLTIATGLGGVSFSIPESAAEYLHGLLE